VNSMAASNFQIYSVLKFLVNADTDLLTLFPATFSKGLLAISL
jgi:hypothetical protein